MPPTFPFGRTVVLHSRGVTGRDADGNDMYGDTDTSIDNVPVWPRSSSELVQGQDTIIVGVSCILPVGVDPTAVDAVTIAGKRYQIDGEPGDLTQSPLTGSSLGWQVNLTRVGA